MTTKREVFYKCHLARGDTFLFTMEKELICSFFGHRNVEINEELFENIKREVVKALEFGCRTFYFGGYGDFDDYCWQTVTSLKKSFPELKIKRVYCVAQEKFLYKPVRYFKRENFDDVIYLPPSFDGFYKSIYFRNCAMIDVSVYVVFYAEEREDSGAYKALKYANRKKRDKVIVNLWQ